MWILLALIAATGAAAREALVKSVMRDGDATAVAFVVAAATALVLLPFVPGALHARSEAVAAASPAAAVESAFWLALLVSGLLNAAAAAMIARAVHLSDLSLAAPLQTMTPLFMIPTGALLLGEVPDARGLPGMLLLVAGAWTLNVARRDAGVLAPLRALAAEPGARLFLGVAALYAVTGTVDKVGVLASAPIVWAFALHAVVAATLLTVSLLRRQGWRIGAVLARAPLRLVLAGVVVAAGAAAQMAALPLTLAAYVISVKRSSVLLSVAAGGLLFREQRLRQRLAGAFIMLCGFVLLTLSGG